MQTQEELKAIERECFRKVLESCRESWEVRKPLEEAHTAASLACGKLFIKPTAYKYLDGYEVIDSRSIWRAEAPPESGIGNLMNTYKGELFQRAEVTDTQVIYQELEAMPVGGEIVEFQALRRAA